MFIQTETTPNPQTMKFLPGQIVLPQGTREFASADEARMSPLAERLFSVDGVSGVFLGYDFVSVTKDQSDWPHLKPAVLGAIMEHYLSGAPVIEDHGPGADTAAGEESFSEEDAEVVDMIKDLIEERVRPAVANDGGDIVFKGYRDGVVYLSMHGACSGCPSSTMTLQMGIQNLLRHFVPEVREVRPV